MVQTHIIITGAADRAALALDALPTVLAHRHDHVHCELQARWVTCTTPHTLDTRRYYTN